MPSRIPNSQVPLTDTKTGIISSSWFRFLSDLFALTGNGRVMSTTLDFPNTAANSSSDLTVTIPGVADGDTVVLGIPAASVPANGGYFAWVSATDTVTVRFINNSTGAINPASGTFKVTTIRY